MRRWPARNARLAKGTHTRGSSLHDHILNHPSYLSYLESFWLNYLYAYYLTASRHSREGEGSVSLAELEVVEALILLASKEDT